MMLDNKSEQKWPLTEKVVRKEQTVKGHFFCVRIAGPAFFLFCREKKYGAPNVAPTYLSYHIRRDKSTIDWCKIYISEGCTKKPELF